MTIKQVYTVSEMYNTKDYILLLTLVKMLFQNKDYSCALERTKYLVTNRFSTYINVFSDTDINGRSWKKQ